MQDAQRHADAGELAVNPAQSGCSYTLSRSPLPGNGIEYTSPSGFAATSG